MELEDFKRLSLIRKTGVVAARVTYLMMIGVAAVFIVRPVHKAVFNWMCSSYRFDARCPEPITKHFQWTPERGLEPLPD